MGEILESTFFSDKLRSIISVVLLVLLMGLIGLSWAFPRESKVSQQTLDTLKEVSGVMKDAALKFEQQSNMTSQLNDTLTKQLQQGEDERNASYNALLQKYGLDPAGGNVTNPFGTLPVVGLRASDDHLGGVNLPPGANATSGTRQLQDASQGLATKTDSGHTGNERSKSSNPSPVVGKPSPVPTGQ